MTTYNKEFKWNPARRKKQRYALVERVVDFSKLPWTSGVDASNPQTTAWAAGDVLEAIHVRAGQTVLGVQIEIMTKGNVTLSKLKVGYGDDATFWGQYAFGPINESSTGVKNEGTGMKHDAVIKNFGHPLYFSSADTIDITINKAITAGKIRLIVHLTEDDR